MGYCTLERQGAGQRSSPTHLHLKFSDVLGESSTGLSWSSKLKPDKHLKEKNEHDFQELEHNTPKVPSFLYSINPSLNFPNLKVIMPHFLKTVQFPLIPSVPEMIQNCSFPFRKSFPQKRTTPIPHPCYR